MGENYFREFVTALGYRRNTRQDMSSTMLSTNLDWYCILPNLQFSGVSFADFSSRCMLQCGQMPLYIMDHLTKPRINYVYPR